MVFYCGSWLMRLWIYESWHSLECKRWHIICKSETGNTTYHSGNLKTWESRKSLFLRVTPKVLLGQMSQLKKRKKRGKKDTITLSSELYSICSFNELAKFDQHRMITLLSPLILILVSSRSVFMGTFRINLLPAKWQTISLFNW